MTKTRSIRIKEMAGECAARTKKLVIALVIAGFIFVGISFLSEINFHFIQGFTQENFDSTTFWKAEYAEVFNSITFLIIAGISFALAIFFYRKDKKRK